MREINNDGVASSESSDAVDANSSNHDLSSSEVPVLPESASPTPEHSLQSSSDGSVRRYSPRTKSVPPARYGIDD